jgi:LPXTG-motif cell wall-anchored protein
MYAVRGSDTSAGVHAPPGASACPALVGHPFRRALEITAAAVAGLLVVGLAGWSIVRRRR